MEIRNAEVGMKYVKDGEAKWIPVVEGGGRTVLGVGIMIIVGI